MQATMGHQVTASGKDRGIHQSSYTNTQCCLDRINSFDHSCRSHIARTLSIILLLGTHFLTGFEENLFLCSSINDRDVLAKG